MANGTEQTQTETKEDVKRKLAEFKAKKQVQSLPDGTQADAERASQSPVHDSKPVRVVEPKVFPVIKSIQSGIPCYTTVMTFQDVCDYGGMAEDLYEDDNPSVIERWQRYYDAKRGKAAAEYLTTNPIHFFPGLIACPVNGTYEALADPNITSINLAAKSIAWLDGQHRAGGISEALILNPKLANETIVVSILRVDPGNIDDKQQLFSDVNKNPKKTSKALNLAYDHTDPVVLAAKHLSEALSGNTVGGHQTLVDWERTAAKKGESVVMTLTNLTNLLKPEKNKESFLVRDLHPDELAETIKAVVLNLPQVEAIRRGEATLGTVQKTQICYYSSVWQAMGRCLNDMVSAKNEAGDRVYSPAQFASVVRDKMRHILNTDGWSISSKRWNDPDQRVAVESKGGYRVGSRTEDVSNATKVLRNLGLRVD